MHFDPQNTSRNAYCYISLYPNVGVVYANTSMCGGLVLSCGNLVLPLLQAHLVLSYAGLVVQKGLRLKLHSLRPSPLADHTNLYGGFYKHDTEENPNQCLFRSIEMLI